MSTLERDDLLTRVASFYYEQDFSQQQIAERLNLSRSMISRMLKEAKQKGLVEIRIHKRIQNSPALEHALEERFGLHRAMIVDVRDSDPAERLAAAGQLAAWYLEETLRPQSRLAIAWGTGVASAVNALPDLPHLEVDVVQMLGTVGSVDPNIDGPDLARNLAQKLGGQYRYLHAPLFVDSPATRDVFLEQPSIKSTLEAARQAEAALVGIGTTETRASSFLRAGHLTEKQLLELQRQGAVGETGGKHFDINGSAGFDINQRVISVNLSDLKRIPYVVAVACGLFKRRSILGALRGGYVKALATDAETAEAVLQEDRLG